MSKNIVFCADGTWNGPGEPDSDDKTAAATNVFKLFLNLDGRDTPDTYLLEKEQERVLTAADGTTPQVAKYLDGVGDSDKARIDPARNMRQFYRLDVQPDMFGGFAVVKEWAALARAGAWGKINNATDLYCQQQFLFQEKSYRCLLASARLATRSGCRDGAEGVSAPRGLNP
jgi:predicted DNA-binding WGR domain protein